jgi:formylglycine-generating enzyme required for sulfatase activity
MDAGYGMQGISGGPSPTVAVYEKLTGSKFWRIDQVKASMATLAVRYSELAGVGRATRTAVLADTVRKNSDPAMALDSWQRLGAADVNWPATAEDLEAERQLRQNLVNVIKGRTKSADAARLADQRLATLDKELKQRGPAMWRKFVTARRSEAEVPAALSKALDKELLIELGIGNPFSLDPPLPPAVQFNIFLFQNKPKVGVLPEKMDDKAAQVQVRAMRDVMPGGDDAVLREFRQKLEELLKEQGGAAAMVEAGPASPEAQKLGNWVRGGTEEVLTFTNNNHQLTFVRFEGAIEADGRKAIPYYLSTTEVTLALFADMMSAAQSTPDDLALPSSSDMRGPQLWERFGGGMKESAFWLKKVPQVFADYPPALMGPARRLAGATHNPQTDMPMQYVTPEAALFIAAQLGCRLPTYTEWKFAAAKHPVAPGQLPNLRDATWAMQFAHVASLRGAGMNQAKWPDVGMFEANVQFGAGDKATAWTAATLQQAGLGGIANGYNDQYLWLRPVTPDPAMSDLYGNVSELVFAEPVALDKLPDKSFATMTKVVEANAKKLLAVGGSYISAPEFGLDKQAIDLNPGFADVGFRLAFAASKRAIVDRLKGLMDEQPYIASAGPTTVPAN